MLGKVRFAIALVTGGAASLFCIVAGAVLLFGAEKTDTLGAALGLYFIGKGFFVGPMLVVTAWPRISDHAVPTQWE